MALSRQDREAERHRIARLVLDLVKQRGTEIPYQTAVAESGLTRARFEQLFEDYDDLFDAIAQIWLRRHIEVMEDVLGADLPPPRKMYEFFRRRFVISRQRFRDDPEYFTIVCEMRAANFDKVRSYFHLSGHYLCELILPHPADRYFARLTSHAAPSLINQMVQPYTMPEALIYVGDKLTEDKLARIVDTMFIGLTGETGGGARGVNTLRVAS